MTKTDTADTTTSDALTTEQIKLANKLTQIVVDTEAQGSLAVLQQARAFQQIRDEGLFRGVQKADGGNYVTFGDYIRGTTTKSDAVISQNISVVAAFSGYPDEKLAAAGTEKLYIAWKMKGEGIYGTLDEVLEAATNNNKLALREIRSSGKATKLSLVYLSALRVTQSQADRFDAIINEKFRATYDQVHQDEGGASDAQVVDHLLNVVGGLPNDFLLMAAAGEGGAAPTAATVASDLTDEDLAYYFADALIERGTNPDEVFERIRDGIKGREDRWEVEKREREERDRETLKAEKEAGKLTAKHVTRLQKVADHTVIDFADGALAEVLGTEVDNGNGVQRIMLKGLRDGSENIYNATGEWYKIEDIARHGPVEYHKPEKAKPAPKQAEPKEKKASSKKAKSEDEGSTLGMSKAQQAGRKPKKAKATTENADAAEEVTE